MPTLRDIRQRIGGVKSTEKITKAMKMVAAAKMRRAQENILQARPYAQKMSAILHHLATKVDVSQYPHFAQREVRSVAIVIITADRGLCGAFNSNVIKAAANHIKTNYSSLYEQGKVSVICVGKKGYEYFSKREYDIFSQHVGIFNSLQFSVAKTAAQELIEGFLTEKFDKVEIIFNEFKSAAQQKVVVEQFLPIVPPTETQKHSSVDYIYEPSSAEIVSALIPRHLNFQIWRMLLDSNAAEQSARMMAMENASSNAKELIRTLQLSYNKARQAAITGEILEIVGGAEALKG